MTKVIQLIIFGILNNLLVFGQEIPIPKNYSIVDTTFGDLDNDGEDELVVAFNTKEDTENEGVPRELIIFKKISNEWEIWKKSQQALYGSRDGGMMGDPFEDIKVTKGNLEISHNGGSSWKWGHTDKYRFQNGAFYLIGYTSVAGKICEYWEQVDFNLSTGKMIVLKEYEDCDKDQEIYKKENETLFKKGLKITLQNRMQKEIKIVTPKYAHEIYIAVIKTD